MDDERLERMEKLLEAVADHLMPMMFGFIVNTAAASDISILVKALPGQVIPPLSEGDHLVIDPGFTTAELVRITGSDVERYGGTISIYRAADTNSAAVAHAQGAYLQLLRQRP